MKTTFKEVLNAINESPSGAFVGLTDYVDSKGDVTSVTGHIGASYGSMKENAIAELKQAIEDEDFSDTIVSGKCNAFEGEFNARKKLWDVEPFIICYDKEQVITTAKEILEGWENPKTRKKNGVELSEKENGLVFNKETGTFNFTLMVEKETYKEALSESNKEGKEVKEKTQAPITMLKSVIRKRFEKKIKSYTIGAGKFKQLSIAGYKFKSEEITF